MLMPKKQFQLIRIPKTASGTLISTFGRKYEVGHHHRLTYIPIEDRKHKFLAAFVRNPWDRLVSKWLHIKRESDKVANVLNRHPNVVITNQYKSFNDFAQDINNIPISNSYRLVKDHMTWLLLPCCNWLYNEHGTIDEIDFIGRFENLYANYINLCKAIGIQPHTQLPHNNKSHGRRHYSCYYTSDKAIQAVADFAKDDIIHFGYEFSYS